MGAVLARGWEVCAEASRRKYFSAGGARGADIGSGRRAIGLDLGGDNFGAAQTTDSHEPGRAVAFLRSARRHLQKKSLRAAEQQRADVARARRRWIGEHG